MIRRRIATVVGGTRWQDDKGTRGTTRCARSGGLAGGRVCVIYSYPLVPLSRKSFFNGLPQSLDALGLSLDYLPSR